MEIQGELVVFELMSITMFLGLAIFGVINLFRAKAYSDIYVGMNNPSVSTQKPIENYANKLLLLAHRRAAVERIPSISKRMIEIRYIDDELIRIAKKVKLTVKK